MHTAKVNERLQTTAPGVWAIREVAGSPQFTHISHDDFRVVHSNLRGGNRVTTRRQVPYCPFTDPELARVGLNEREAKEQNVAYRLFKIPMEANMRARTLSETRGFLKALVVSESDRILGFTAFAVRCGRNYVRRAGSRYCRTAVYRAAGCRFDSSHTGRGTDFADAKAHKAKPTNTVPGIYLHAGWCHPAKRFRSERYD
jgi:Pyridine nucleotide-disulphide oxidoreductase, dimerisation domain